MYKKKGRPKPPLYNNRFVDKYSRLCFNGIACWGAVTLFEAKEGVGFVGPIFEFACL